MTLRALSLSLLLAATPPAIAAETWRMYSYVPNANLPVGKGLVRIAERITAETNGALRVQLSWGGSLPIKASDITQAVGDDVVQMASDGFYAGNVPLASILRMPMLVTSTAEYRRSWPLVRPGVEAAFARAGASVAGYYLYEAVTIFTNRPVTKASDLDGLKIRQADPISTDIMRSYGATTVTMGTSEVATALQQGVVNGTITTSAGGGKIWAEQLTHNYRLPLYVPEGFVIVNKKRLDALPPAVQETVRRVVAEETARISAENEREERETLAAHRSKGMVITPASDAELADARRRMDAVWSKWAGANGAQAQQLLAEVRRSLGR